MSEFEIVWHATLIRWVGWILVLASVVAIGFSLFCFVDHALVEDDFRVICEYRGGTVEGNVCIKDGTVIDRWTYDVPIF